MLRSSTIFGQRPLNTAANSSYVKFSSRMFSIVGRLATWQRSRLYESTIEDIMMYKAAMNLEEAWTVTGYAEINDWAHPGEWRV